MQLRILFNNPQIWISICQFFSSLSVSLGLSHYFFQVYSVLFWNVGQKSPEAFVGGKSAENRLSVLSVKEFNKGEKMGVKETLHTTEELSNWSDPPDFRGGIQRRFADGSDEAISEDLWRGEDLLLLHAVGKLVQVQCRARPHHVAAVATEKEIKIKQLFPSSNPGFTAARMGLHLLSYLIPFFNSAFRTRPWLQCCTIALSASLTCSLMKALFILVSLSLSKSALHVLSTSASMAFLKCANRSANVLMAASATVERRLFTCIASQHQ